MKKFILTTLSMFLLASAGMLCAENVGVPSECEDVMLQAFYWDSYKKQIGTDSPYGRTRWIDLINDTAALNANFDVLWFPPSAYADGGNGKGGVGYSVKQYSNQNSDWGTDTKLKELIAALHKGNTKVLADVVVNHRRDSASWTLFHRDDFGKYGSYKLLQTHICYYDDCFTNKNSPVYNAPASQRGANDTGSDFDGARDLDHTSEYVQEWAKAYVQWLLDEMKYDGFRYDMTLGYHGKYLKMYNEASNPYLSVSELWDGIDRQIQHLQECDYNTMIFDFPLKYALQNALGVDGSSGETRYNLLNNPSNSLRNKGYKRYAVTFIDNHDTFERSDSQENEFIKYNADLKDADVKRRIMEANAYILMMPGVPCVFYPHWASYKEEINALIAIRKEAGLHSESEITETSSSKARNRSYEATVTGHRGTVILRMGVNRSKEAPEGYEQVLDGGDAGNYTIFLSKGTQGMESVEGSLMKGQKFIKDGQLFIRLNDEVYTILGEKIL